MLLTIPGLALVTGFLRNLPRQIAEPATQHKPREKQENLSCFLTHKLPFLLERYRLLQLKTMLAQSESSFSEILGSFSYRVLTCHSWFFPSCVCNTLSEYRLEILSMIGSLHRHFLFSHWHKETTSLIHTLEAFYWLKEAIWHHSLQTYSISSFRGIETIGLLNN